MIKEIFFLNAINIAVEAGKKIIEIYNNDDYKVENKSDNSPLTLADKTSNTIITNKLQSVFPILSEEGKHTGYEIRKNWDYFWLIDPLDGTKEFIKKNGEFTVNIALIKKDQPVMGVIFVPVTQELYFGSLNHGAYKLTLREFENFSSFNELIRKAIKLPINNNRNNFVIVASRSHMNDETKEFIEKLKSKYKNAELKSRGSSLKLCMVAEGNADIYPRFAPTMEWDTAAGHAIAHAAGCKIVKPDGSPVKYNKKELLNPWFIVYAGNFNDNTISN
ncbi:MAG: 3'(2'),5'-bisphosphate nucleotidase CysQ [Marinilabiliales bacterium]